MCTAFIKRGTDLLFGYSLDLDPEAWDYRIVKNKSLFTVAIRVGSTTYYTHGVNASGRFANLPYMNGEDTGHRGVGRNQYRIDLLADRYIRGRLSYAEVLDIARTKTVISGAGGSFHSLIGDAEGHILLLEPVYGFRAIDGDYACVTNYPAIPVLSDYSNPFYGKERCDAAAKILSESGADFGVEDGLRLLETVKQEGQWGTRLSFLYSRRENAVYYCIDGDFEHVEKWQFTSPAAQQEVTV